MPDLGTRIRAHYEHIAPAIDVEAVADRMEVDSLAVGPWRTRRAFAIALIAALVTVLAIGLPLWLVRGGEETPVAPTLPPPSSTTPAVTTGSPAPPTTAPSTAAPATTSTTVAPPAWITFTEDAGLPGGPIHQLLVAADGSVWAIGDGVSRFAAGRWEPVVLPNDFSIGETDYPIGRRAAVKAASAPNGAVWFAHAGGIHSWHGGNWTAHQAPSHPDCEPGWCGPATIAVMGDGRVWTAGADYVFVLVDDSWEVVGEDFAVTSERQSALGGVNELVSGEDGSLWYSTFDELVRYDGVETFATPYGFDVPWRWTQVLAGDVQGRAWVVVGYTEPDRYLMYVTELDASRSDWPTYALGDASAVTVAPDGDVWVAVSSEPIDPWNGDFGVVEAVSESGAYRFDGEAWTRFDTNDGLAADDVRSVAVGADGVVWFGTSQGVSRFDPSGGNPGGETVDPTW